MILQCSEVLSSTGVMGLAGILGPSGMLAYLTYMAERLEQMHRLLKPTGSLYFHCDPTASHYLKIVLDGVFGGTGFINEVSWRRTTTKGDYRQGARNWPRVRDVILHYAPVAGEAGRPFHQPFAPLAFAQFMHRSRRRPKRAAGACTRWLPARSRNAAPLTAGRRSSGPTKGIAWYLPASTARPPDRASAARHAGRP